MWVDRRKINLIYETFHKLIGVPMLAMVALDFVEYRRFGFAINYR